MCVGVRERGGCWLQRAPGEGGPCEGLQGFLTWNCDGVGSRECARSCALQSEAHY